MVREGGERERGAQIHTLGCLCLESLSYYSTVDLRANPLCPPIVLLICACAASSIPVGVQWLSKKRWAIQFAWYITIRYDTKRKCRASRLAFMLRGWLLQLQAMVTLHMLVSGPLRLEDSEAMQIMFISHDMV